MTKKFLALILALVMVVLAIPVFALGTLAAGASGPTLNFRVGATYDEENHTTAPGTIVKSVSLGTLRTNPDSFSITDGDLEGTGVDKMDILTWAYWDATAKKYVELNELVHLMDEMPAVDTIDLYPVLVNTTYTDGLPIISKTGNTLKLEAYRSGWTFTTPYGKTDGMRLMDVEQGTKDGLAGFRGYLQIWIGDNAAKYGAVLQNGDILLGDNAFPEWAEYATGLSYEATVSGTYKVTIPKASDIHVLVVVDDTCVFGPADLVNLENPALDKTSSKAVLTDGLNQDWFTFGTEGSPSYSMMTDEEITVSLMKGEQVHIIVKRRYPEDGPASPEKAPARDDQWLRGWAPTVEFVEYYFVDFSVPSTTESGYNPGRISDVPVDFLPAIDKFFSPSELEIEGSLDWATFDSESGTYITLDDYLSGKVAVKGPLPFSPIMEDSATAPYTQSTGKSENPVLFSFDGTPTAGSVGKLLSYTGGWSYGSYAGSIYTPFNKIVYEGGDWRLLNAASPTKGGVAIGQNGGFISTLPADNAATTMVYHAIENGQVKVKIPKSATANLAVAVAKNGTFVWPTSLAGTPATAPTAATVSSFYAVPTAAIADRDTRYNTANCQSFTLNVGEGDRIEFLIVNKTASATEAWYPAVEYTAFFEAPTLEVTPSFDDGLSASFAAKMPAGSHYAGLEKGVLINGTADDAISVAPPDADKTFRVQAFYKLDENTTILSEEKVISINSLLKHYENNATYGDAAKAALNYTAAYSGYFDRGTIPSISDFEGSYNTTMGLVDYTGENEVTIHHASLIVEDKIGIKLVVSGLPTGATLQIASDRDFINILNAGNNTFTKTTDNKAHKYIMEGISVANFDTMYYFRVVDASGTPISDTIQYSVSTYCARMGSADKLVANYKLYVLCHAMMSLYEAIGD